jgi:hypothetical protein
MPRMTLDEKQAEKQRLAKAYTFYKRAEWQALCEQEPRLLTLRKAIRASRDPERLYAMLADSWVRFAPAPVGYAVLRLVDRQADKIRREQGGEGLSDPIPPARNLFIAVREMLKLR